MTFRLIETEWDREFEAAVRTSASGVRIVSPFIKLGAAERLVRSGGPGVVQVITRFDLNGFYTGVSDIAALRLLLHSGARIQGVRHLHAKMYLFGDERANVTSANLTEAALVRGHEFGFFADDTEILSACRRYFDGPWKRAGQDLRPAQAGRVGAQDRSPSPRRWAARLSPAAGRRGSRPGYPRAACRRVRLLGGRTPGVRQVLR